MLWAASMGGMHVLGRIYGRRNEVNTKRRNGVAVVELPGPGA